MRRLILTCGFFLATLGHAVTVQADFDERPLSVRIEPAFPELQWPAWLTGEEEGQARKILPVVVTGAGDGSNRMFVASQYGTIFHFDNSPKSKQLTKFLDIRDRVSFKEKENEEGFLGLAFHPQFANNGQFYVFYTPKDLPRRSVISRFSVSATDPNQADPDSEQIILTVPQPYWNHNGGTLAFGPDGFLYITLGDGGAGKDPHGNGQNLQTLLGAMLRIDVDHQEEGRAYAIPADNPFVGQGEKARGEIWAYGLRNVWRHSFDRKTGVCWAADVGQDLWEEINIIRKGGNYGWNLREGQHPFGPEGSEPSKDLIEPIWEYDRKYGKSITGGHVYRGKKVPELDGAYLYADYVSGHLWALWCNTDTGEVTANRTLRTHGAPVITFGEDDQGEVYFTTPQGDILKFSSP